MPALLHSGQDLAAGDLQRGGFDVQLTGYGLASTYHADNEYCELTGMKTGFSVLLKVLTILEEK